MAGPQVFVSSTYYDLKHLRSALENFISGLGFEPILSEKGEIAYSPDTPLDESCYRAAKQADIFVLIIGGRYGSAASSEDAPDSDSFFERYNSITMKEYKAAADNDVPIFILIERGVDAEYHTFRKNREKTDITYAHVDSVNIFRLIDDILAQPKNNPVFQFERYQEIEDWLKGQWAGLFNQMLSSKTEQEQLTSLSAQVDQLAETNITMRRYMEAMMSTVSPDTSSALIDEESQRLEEARIESELSQNDFVDYVLEHSNFSLSEIRDAISSANSVQSLVETLQPVLDHSATSGFERWIEEKNKPVLRDLNTARRILGLTAIGYDSSPARKKPATKRKKS